MRDFRFGFTLASPKSTTELTETIRAAEDYGYDTAVTVDHLGPGRTSPFQGALAAAMVSPTIRVGTFVLNVGYWNPTILAREVATIQRLSGGRFELGIGLGVIKSQYLAARIPWLPYADRLARTGETAAEVAELIAKEDGVARSPLMIGSGNEPSLRLAAECADIVSFVGTASVPGEEWPVLVTGDRARERIALFERAAGDRAATVERNVFVQELVVTDDRRAAAEKIAAENAPHLSVDDALDDNPHVLLGTVDEIAEQLVRLRAEHGCTSFYVQRPWMEQLGPVIKRVRELAGRTATSVGTGTGN